MSKHNYTQMLHRSLGERIEQPPDIRGIAECSTVEGASVHLVLKLRNDSVHLELSLRNDVERWVNEGGAGGEPSV